MLSTRMSRGKFWCETCFQNREQVGWDERGNMLEKSRWGDRRGLGFCMWAVFVSDPAGR